MNPKTIAKTTENNKYKKRGLNPQGRTSTPVRASNRCARSQVSGAAGGEGRAPLSRGRNAPPAPETITFSQCLLASLPGFLIISFSSRVFECLVDDFHFFFFSLPLDRYSNYSHFLSTVFIRLLQLHISNRDPYHIFTLFLSTPASSPKKNSQKKLNLVLFFHPFFTPLTHFLFLPLFPHSWHSYASPQSDRNFPFLPLLRL